MTAVQSTYSENLQAARAGLLAGDAYDVESGIVETAAGIGFGLAVAQGTADKGRILADASEHFIGISVRDVTLGAEVDTYPQYGNIGVVKRGLVWVSCASAAAGGKVYFTANTGAIVYTGGELITGARFVTSTDGNGFALVELSGFQNQPAT
jgi:hypothetical protein